MNSPFCKKCGIRINVWWNKFYIETEYCEKCMKKPLEKTMNFSEALELIKQGKKLSREGWNGNNIFVYYVPGSVFTVNRPPLLGIYPEGTEIAYTDLLAQDWIVVE